MRLLTFICTIILIFSCGKDEFEYDYSTGEVNALMNGDPWKSNIRASFIADSLFGISIEKFNNQGILRESTGFQRFNLKEGLIDSFATPSTTLGQLPSTHYARLISDGDLISESYNLDHSKDNFIEIIEINEDSKYIEGRFDLTFNIDTLFGKYDESAPDIVYFTDATFWVKYEE